MYNNDPIEYTNEYQYLGIKFSNTCNFKVAMDELYKKALKVYHTLIGLLVYWFTSLRNDNLGRVGDSTTTVVSSINDFYHIQDRVRCCCIWISW